MNSADLVARLRHGAEHLEEGDTGWPGAYKQAADRRLVKGES